MTFLHAHTGEGVVGFLDEVLWHGFLDTLKLIPFLFLTYSPLPAVLFFPSEQLLYCLLGIKSFNIIRYILSVSYIGQVCAGI